MTSSWRTSQGTLVITRNTLRCFKKTLGSHGLLERAPVSKTEIPLPALGTISRLEASLH